MVMGDGGTQLGMEPEKETSGRLVLVLLFFTLVLSVFSGSDGHKIGLGRCGRRDAAPWAWPARARADRGGSG